ncbi:hypothetical protein JHK87_050153 [Glycine soja]|nr:hypothetical protein JHK87_050153 [Glycine soja]
MFVKIPGVAIICVKSALLCFSNANSVRERQVLNNLFHCYIIMVYLLSIDTSGIASLEELHKSLVSSGKQRDPVTGKEPELQTFWQLTHKRENGEWIDEASKEIKVIAF